MAQKRGRPQADDAPALTRVAALLATGSAKTPRSAILQVVKGEAAVRRLQRKWGTEGAELLAAAKATAERPQAVCSTRADVWEVVAGFQAMSATAHQIATAVGSPHNWERLQALAQTCESISRIFSPKILVAAEALSKFQRQMDAAMSPAIRDALTRQAELQNLYASANLGSKF
jgi:hypothetical protein